MTETTQLRSRIAGIVTLALLLIAGICALTYHLVDGAVNDAKDEANAANSAAVANNQAVQQLAAQVEALGGTPVVDPDDLPVGPAGPAGATGAAGPQGLSCIEQLGLTACRGPQGASGVDGKRGPRGFTGLDGAVGAVGGQGPRGEQGQQGPKGEPGETGATGPQGDPGPKGDTGDPGPQGQPGPTCPDGYHSSIVQVVTVEHPLGESAVVCVAD